MFKCLINNRASACVDKIVYNGRSMRRIFHALNVVEQCRYYRVGLWQCPQFLFIVMGLFVVAAIIVTNLFARRYAGPEITALIVLGVTAVLLAIGQIIINSFKNAAEAMRTKSEFISIMSHQLRGPLAAMRWQFNVLLGGGESTPPVAQGAPSENLSAAFPAAPPLAEELPPLAEEVREVLRTLQDENKRMIRLVSDLLEVNRIDDRDLVLHRGSLKLSDMSRHVLRRFTRFARAANVELKTAFPNDERAVLADEQYVRLVIEHLVDNAIRYSKGGAVVAAIEQLAGATRWSVTDEGIGITDADKKHIFEKFFRGHNAVRYQTDGLGIGLHIARAVVKAHFGTIGFRSQYGRGSTFWFTLPSADA